VAEWEQRAEHEKPRGMVWRYVHGIFLTSLVGSFATLPFAVFHFGRAAHYAVLGNLLAMPVMGFWVMPCAALAVALMPLGLDAPVLKLMGIGIDVMVAMGRWVSGLPGAVSLSPAMPVAALVLFVVGGLWIAIWQTGKRWWGLVPVVVSAVLAVAAHPPDMLVAPDAVTVAIRGDDRLLHFVRKPKDRFIAQEWLRRDGDGRAVADAIGMPGLKCDGVGCVVTRGVPIALSSRAEALEDDCGRAVVLIAPVAADCKGPAVLIDQQSVGQGWQIKLAPLHAQSVQAWRGARPWVARPSTAE
jgi:competence protein ComEC